MITPPLIFFFFFFNDTATTEIYTLSLHDALPISEKNAPKGKNYETLYNFDVRNCTGRRSVPCGPGPQRSEEHTSELQSRLHLVCRLLLEKKKKIKYTATTYLLPLNIITTVCMRRV